ncbi:hypothetical protein Y032_0269g813 [Ancylostoma ceylanicum]|uniref:Uncharacterized protein n=1 Tax=Ancylostoma ceylanicum TaxID=53326 RepID=A0A016S9J4_9BILA|nr:hypothetical protein Y032_0269g813 [Ancylostoma ceylanicum]
MCRLDDYIIIAAAMFCNSTAKRCCFAYELISPPNEQLYKSAVVSGVELTNSSSLQRTVAKVAIKEKLPETKDCEVLKEVKIIAREFSGNF